MMHLSAQNDPALNRKHREGRLTIVRNLSVTSPPRGAPDGEIARKYYEFQGEKYHPVEYFMGFRHPTSCTSAVPFLSELMLYDLCREVKLNSTFSEKYRLSVSWKHECGLQKRASYCSFH